MSALDSSRLVDRVQRHKQPKISRRRFLTSSAKLAGGGAAAQTLAGLPAASRTRLAAQGYPDGFQTALNFLLVEAIYGRRARRFSSGVEIRDGPLAYASDKEPLRLSELERMMVLTAVAGNTGWHHMITRRARYAPHLSDYSAPLTCVDQYSLTECTAELTTSCYAGMLMLQAMSLGGWMFDGIDRAERLHPHLPPGPPPRPGFL